jgi:hypothetical protein
MNKRAHILPMAAALLAVAGRADVNASPEALKPSGNGLTGDASTPGRIPGNSVLGTTPSGAVYELVLERGENGVLLAEHASHRSHSSHHSHHSHASGSHSSHASGSHGSHASHASHGSHSSHHSGF